MLMVWSQFLPWCVPTAYVSLLHLGRKCTTTFGCLIVVMLCQCAGVTQLARWPEQRGQPLAHLPTFINFQYFNFLMQLMCKKQKNITWCMNMLGCMQGHIHKPTRFLKSCEGHIASAMAAELQNMGCRICLMSRLSSGHPLVLLVFLFPFLFCFGVQLYSRSRSLPALCVIPATVIVRPSLCATPVPHYPSSLVYIVCMLPVFVSL